MPQMDVRCSGARPDRAAFLAAQFVEGGCEALLSIGLAGGLDPVLKPGDLIVSSTIIEPDGKKVPSDAIWRDNVVDRLDRARIDYRIGPMLGADELVRSPAAKQSYFSTTGALAVDMESHAVMRVAKAAGIPAIAIRAVADRSYDELPETAAYALTVNGGVAFFSILSGLMRRPSDLGGMLMLARRSAQGFAALRRVAALPLLREPF